MVSHRHLTPEIQVSGMGWEMGMCTSNKSPRQFWFQWMLWESLLCCVVWQNIYSGFDALFCFLTNRFLSSNAYFHIKQKNASRRQEKGWMGDSSKNGRWISSIAWRETTTCLTPIRSLSENAVFIVTINMFDSKNTI